MARFPAFGSLMAAWTGDNATCLSTRPRYRWPGILWTLFGLRGTSSVHLTSSVLLVACPHPESVATPQFSGVVKDTYVREFLAVLTEAALVGTRFMPSTSRVETSKVDRNDRTDGRADSFVRGRWWSRRTSFAGPPTCACENTLANTVWAPNRSFKNAHRHSFKTGTRIPRCCPSKNV